VVKLEYKEVKRAAARYSNQQKVKEESSGKDKKAVKK